MRKAWTALRNLDEYLTPKMEASLTFSRSLQNAIWVLYAVAKYFFTLLKGLLFHF